MTNEHFISENRDLDKIINYRPISDQLFLLQLPHPMNHIWSPWRMKYIENTEKEEGCVFCNAHAKEDSAENLIAFRGERAFVILNLYPYTSGHLMVVPFEHIATLEELDPATRAEMMELTSQCTTVLRKIYQSAGIQRGRKYWRSRRRRRAWACPHSHRSTLGCRHKFYVRAG